jgi:hypothetical protein
MQKESLNTKTGDNYRLPKNIIMIIAIVALGTAAAFTIASTRNTDSIQFNAMEGPQAQKQIRPGVIEDEEIDEEESDKESEKDEESTDSEKMSRPDHADRLPGGLEPQPQGQAPAPGSNDQTTQIILFSVEAIAASLLIIYLIMSGLNKKSFKETLSNSDKALIFILSSILLAAAFVVTDVLIANAINGKPNEAPQGQQMQIQGPQQGHPQMRAPRGFGKPKLDKS